jgi:hypothetical protein
MAAYASVTTDFDANLITIEFGDGTKREFRPSDYPQEIRDRLELHGLKQKLVDSYSGAKKAVEDGDSESEVSYAQESVEDVHGNLADGSWTSRRESGGARTTQLARAVAEVLGIPVAEAAEKLAGMEDDAKKALAKHPKVQIALIHIRQAAEQARLEKLEANGADDLPDLG